MASPVLAVLRNPWPRLSPCVVPSASTSLRRWPDQMCPVSLACCGILEGMQVEIDAARPDDRHLGVACEVISDRLADDARPVLERDRDRRRIAREAIEQRHRPPFAVESRDQRRLQHTRRLTSSPARHDEAMEICVSPPASATSEISGSPQEATRSIMLSGAERRGYESAVAAPFKSCGKPEKARREESPPAMTKTTAASRARLSDIGCRATHVTHLGLESSQSGLCAVLSQRP